MLQHELQINNAFHSIAINSNDKNSSGTMRLWRLYCGYAIKCVALFALMMCCSVQRARSAGDCNRHEDEATICRLDGGNQSDFPAAIEACGAGNITRQRVKRFLTFSGGGVVKFVFGIGVPVPLPTKKRSLSMFYNVHIQYTPPPRPLYWWSPFNTSTFAARRESTLSKAMGTEAMTTQHDVSRELVYRFIENWLTQRKGAGAGVCLLHAICSVSQLPFIEEADSGLFAALLNALLIPTESITSSKFWAAHEAGRHGADCQRTFPECSTELIYWLKQFTYLL